MGLQPNVSGILNFHPQFPQEVEIAELLGGTVAVDGMPGPWLEDRGLWCFSLA